MTEFELMNELLSSVGFPIFACIIMFYQNQKFSNVLNNITIEIKTMNSSLNDLKHKMDK